MGVSFEDIALGFVWDSLEGVLRGKRYEYQFRS